MVRRIALLLALAAGASNRRVHAARRRSADEHVQDER